MSRATMGSEESRAAMIAAVGTPKYLFSQEVTRGDNTFSIIGFDDDDTEGQMFFKCVEDYSEIIKQAEYWKQINKHAEYFSCFTGYINDQLVKHEVTVRLTFKFK